MSQTDEVFAVDEALDEFEDESPQRSKKGLMVAIGIVAALLVIALLVFVLIRATADDGPDPVAVTVPVALADVSPPANATIGVVLTLGTGITDGSQWYQAAQGAVVAQERLALGGNDVALVTADDMGEATGSAEAVQSLLEQGVSGIVYASSGAHLADGLDAAAEAGVPVILPYAQAPEDASNVWSLAPTDAELADTLANAVAQFERPLHINAGADLPEAVNVSANATFDAETNLDDFAEDIALRTGANPYANGGYTGGGEDEQGPAPIVENPADVVVVSGSAAMQARVVYALQTGNVSVPIILTAEAVSPVFDQTLLELGGTVSSNLRTVGAGWDDGIALGSSGQARAMSAFLSALRQFSGDESVTNLSGDAAFAQAAGVADVRGHDAVIALVEALSEAGTTDATAVAEALQGLQLAAGNGIAGPGLDFGTPQAITTDPTMLHASSQQLGLRPTTGEHTDALVWINRP